MSTKQCDLLIVGAGLCGLVLARQLDLGRTQVTLVDKGRSVGGRLATRRIGPGRADHGAQFFTARAEDFSARVEQWERDGLVYRWATGWNSGSLGWRQASEHPRYAVRDGMNSLPKALAGELAAAGATVTVDARVEAVTLRDDQWLATGTDGATCRANMVVLTAPAAQSLALLDAGALPLHPEDRRSLMRITYAPCLCGLFWVEGDVALPEPGARQTPGAAISWIADNQRKGISPAARILTVHAGPEMSQARYAHSESAVLAWMTSEVAPLLAPDGRIVEAQLKRWRYALPTVLHDAPFLRLQGLPPLYIGGDAFGGPRIEGAALSGLAIAQDLIGSGLVNGR